MQKNDSTDLTRGTDGEPAAVSAGRARRKFLGGVGGAALVAGSGALGLPLAKKLVAGNGNGNGNGNDNGNGNGRIDDAYKIRTDAAKNERQAFHPQQATNG